MNACLCVCVCGGGAHRRGNLLFNYAFNIQDDVWLITTNVRTQNNYVKTITSSGWHMGILVR